jgi:hypothetical protein
VADKTQGVATVMPRQAVEAFFGDNPAAGVATEGVFLACLVAQAGEPVFRVVAEVQRAAVLLPRFETAQGRVFNYREKRGLLIEFFKGTNKRYKNRNHPLKTTIRQ